jgi:hypothetical protein
MHASGFTWFQPQEDCHMDEAFKGTAFRAEIVVFGQTNR